MERFIWCNSKNRETHLEYPRCNSKKRDLFGATTRIERCNNMVTTRIERRTFRVMYTSANWRKMRSKITSEISLMAVLSAVVNVPPVYSL